MPATTKQNIERAQRIARIIDQFKSLKGKSDKIRNEGIQSIVKEVDAFNKENPEAAIDKNRVLSHCLRESQLFPSTIPQNIKSQLPFDYWRGSKLNPSEMIQSSFSKDMKEALPKQAQYDSDEEDDDADANADFLETREALKDTYGTAKSEEPRVIYTQTLEENIEILIRKLNQEKIKHTDSKPGLVDKLIPTFGTKPLNASQKSRIHFLKSQIESFRMAVPGAVSLEELSKIASYCIDESDFFRAKQNTTLGMLPSEIIQALAEETDSLPGITYTPGLKKKDLASVQKEARAQVETRIERHKEYEEARKQMLHSNKPPQPPEFSSPPPFEALNKHIQSELLTYKQTVNADNKAQEGIDKPKSGFLWSSDQVAKFKIVDDLTHKLAEKPLTQENANHYLKVIHEAIKANKKATGNSIFHRKNRLDKILKTIEAEIVNIAPHAKSVNMLEAYIEKATREDVEKKAPFRGPFESDRDSKLKLAKKLLEGINKGTIAENGRTEKQVIEHFLTINKEFNKGKYGGLHRAGELEKILKNFAKEIDAKESKPAKGSAPGK